MTHPDGTRRSLLTFAAAAPLVFSAGGLTAQPAGPNVHASRPFGAGKVALITGGSRGIGAATARRLAQEGFAVAINYLSNRAMAEQVVRQIVGEGGRAFSHQSDVADAVAVNAFFSATEESFGGIDVVVNNAGIMNVGMFADMSDAAFSRMIATNITGSFIVLREAARRTRNGGQIISLSSSIIRQAPAGAGAYAATKAAQELYTRSLSRELAGRGIRVNAVSPGAVDTQLLRQHGEEVLKGIPAQTPLGRIGRPEDIANVIATLCSPDGAWIDGQNLFVNGGIA